MDADRSNGLPSMTADPSFNLCPKHTCDSLSPNSIFNVTRKCPAAFRVKSLLRTLTRSLTSRQGSCFRLYRPFLCRKHVQ
ncbi:hypothetical protein HK096_005208 [Nowakowskiella sp. JEL0078]|nr:hypothetical protein HK096_005208 [Nowakowskiella sp. JEL0078]